MGANRPGLLAEVLATVYVHFSSLTQLRLHGIVAMILFAVPGNDFSRSLPASSLMWRGKGLDVSSARTIGLHEGQRLACHHPLVSSSSVPVVFRMVLELGSSF